MAIANVGSRWENGDQVFFSRITGAVIMTLKGDGTLEIEGFGQAAAQANSVASDTAGIVTDFNNLLVNLRTAGIIAT